SRPPEFFHMGSAADCQAHVVAERPDIGTSITGDTKHCPPPGDLQYIESMNCPYPEVSCNRAFEGRPLVYAACEFHCGAFYRVFPHVFMKADHCDVLFILGKKYRCKADGIADHHYKNPGDTRVKCASMAYPCTENIPCPCGDLMAGRAPWLVKHQQSMFRDRV